MSRQDTLRELVIAWAEYERSITGIVAEAQASVAHDGGLHQAVGMLGSVIDGSADLRRSIALQLAIAEVSRPTPPP